MGKARDLDAVMLSELPRTGERTVARILQVSRRRGEALAALFELPEEVLRLEYELHPAAVECVVQHGATHAARCRWLLGQLAGVGGHVWLTGDPAYPVRLRHRLDRPPPVLYAQGEAAALDRPTLAVLNSRAVTEQAVAASVRAVQAAAAQGFTLVSGGMKTSYRITAVAGRAAPRRIIVLDRGLLATLGARAGRDPFGFEPGHRRLDTSRTLVVSPFRLLDWAAPRNGRRRDELVAALADVVVAVHASAGGEIERVCFAALDRGQCVLSWQGENPGLVAAGATVIDAGDLPSLGRFVSG